MHAARPCIFQVKIKVRFLLQNKKKPPRPRSFFFIGSIGRLRSVGAVFAIIPTIFQVAAAAFLQKRNFPQKIPTYLPINRPIRRKAQKPDAQASDIRSSARKNLQTQIECGSIGKQLNCDHDAEHQPSAEEKRQRSNKCFPEINVFSDQKSLVNQAEDLST